MQDEQKVGALSVIVCGLGAMGGAMAQHLVESGWSVVGVDPSPNAIELGDQGVNVFHSLPEACAFMNDTNTDVAFALMSLPSAAIVEASVPDALEVPGLRVIVDASTSAPDASRAMAQVCEQKGVAFVDCPVSGGRSGSLTGTLTGFVGGTDEAVAEAGPLLDALTSNFAHVGDTGAGNVVKLVNNMLCAANIVAVSEASAIAAAHGVDVGEALRTVSGASGASKVSESMFPNWVLSGTYSSGFTTALMARDATLGIETAQSGGALETPFLGHAAERWTEAQEALDPSADFMEAAPFFAGNRDVFPEPDSGDSATAPDGLATVPDGLAGDGPTATADDPATDAPATDSTTKGPDQ